MFKNLRQPGTAGSPRGARRAGSSDGAAFSQIGLLRVRLGMRRYRLSEAAHVDERYLARLESGRAAAPGRDVALRVGKALADYSSAVTRKDVDRLLDAAGYPPSPDWLWELPAGDFGMIESHVAFYGRWQR